jgi:hypothetical protein
MTARGYSVVPRGSGCHAWPPLIEDGHFATWAIANTRGGGGNICGIEPLTNLPVSQESHNRTPNPISTPSMVAARRSKLAFEPREAPPPLPRPTKSPGIRLRLLRSLRLDTTSSDFVLLNRDRRTPPHAVSRERQPPRPFPSFSKPSLDIDTLF